QAEDGIRDFHVTGVQTCALPILVGHSAGSIVLGHLLDRLAVSQVKVTSCTLYAPACTVAFAIEKYLDKNTSVFDPGQLHLHYLRSEERRVEKESRAEC